METWQAINTVRAVRTFSDEPIAAADLERILNAGRRTGSSKNDQHWAFIVLRDCDHLRELAAVGHYADHLTGATVAIAIVTPNAERAQQQLGDVGLRPGGAEHGACRLGSRHLQRASHGVQP